MTLEQYFATSPAFEQPIFESVATHLGSLGPLVVEAVSVGVFFKRTRTFAELRPMRDRVRLAVLLSRRLQHPRIVKTCTGSAMRSAYFVDLRGPADVDEDVLDWLTEAYLSSPVE